MNDIGVWIGVAFTFLVAAGQVYIAWRISRIEDKIKLQTWGQARNTFFTECFLLSGDLMNALRSYTEMSDSRVYIVENMEFPLHEIVNRSEHIYTQARINSSGLNDQEIAELSNQLSKIRFAANFARDALRSWDAVENELPLRKEVEGEHAPYLVPVGPKRMTNPNRHASINGKHFDGLAIGIRECFDRTLLACQGFFKFALENTDDGKQIEKLFPPGWYTDSAEELNYKSFRENCLANFKVMQKRLSAMDDRGLCLIKAPEDRPASNA